MNLDELRAVQSKERQKDSLQHLRETFYQEVADYVAERKRERERLAEEADDPFSSPAVMRLTDEIETATDVVEAIYERRMGKLVKQASLAAAGMPADDEGLTEEERELFDDLVECITQNKQRVLDVLSNRRLTEFEGSSESGRGSRESDEDRGGEGELAGSEAVADSAADDPDQGSVSVADVMGGGDGLDDASTDIDRPPQLDHDAPGPNESATEDHAEHEREHRNDDEPTDASDGDAPAAVDRTTVVITRDVGSILGVDEREYHLAADDVVKLPTENAKPLVERGAAEPIE